MNETEDYKEIHTCDFCESTSDNVENLFVAPGDTPVICDRCVRVCEAMFVDAHIPLSHFCRIPGKLHDQRKEKLRPITRIQKIGLSAQPIYAAVLQTLLAVQPMARKVKDLRFQNNLHTG